MKPSKKDPGYKELAEKWREQANMIADILGDPKKQEFITENKLDDDLELLLLMALHYERELAGKVAMIQLNDPEPDMGCWKYEITH